MAASFNGDLGTENPTCYDRFQELKAFDESKAGVKGLVDAGITQIPRIFRRIKAEDDHDYSKPTQNHFAIPVIDLEDSENRSYEMVAGVQKAAVEFGFFQVVNHGVPQRVLDEMLAAARGFHELPSEVKKRYYTRETTKKAIYSSNFDLYESRFANWRDTLFCVMGPEPLDPQELPLVCRDITMEYSKEIHKLGATLFELLSKAIGLNPDYLLGLDCAKGHCLLSNYYPACPEPELTMGTTKHSDPDFLTILLQDQIGGLQVFHQNQWIDVPFVPGALVVNIGDLLQLISNDKLKSVEHRGLVFLSTIQHFHHTASAIVHGFPPIIFPLERKISKKFKKKNQEKAMATAATCFHFQHRAPAWVNCRRRSCSRSRREMTMELSAAQGHSKTSESKRCVSVKCSGSEIGIGDFIGGDLLRFDLGRWLSDVEEHKALAIYTPHEGGYEGRYLTRLRYQGYYFLDLTARGLGDPETTLTKIHPVCPAHVGKQPIARWYFPPEVDYRLQALPHDAKGLVLWIIEAKVLSKSELQFLALLPTLRPKVRVIAECGNWRKFMWKPLKAIAGLIAEDGA